MTEMSKAETRRFIMQGTLTGKLATIKKDRSPHVIPIWFVVDDGNTKSMRDIIFTTTGGSVKAKNIYRNKRVSICVDDQVPPFFVCNNIWHYKNIPLQAKGGPKMDH